MNESNDICDTVPVETHIVTTGIYLTMNTNKTSSNLKVTSLTNIFGTILSFFRF